MILITKCCSFRALLTALFELFRPYSFTRVSKYIFFCFSPLSASQLAHFPPQRLLATRVNTKFKNERKPSVRARRLRKSPFSLSEEFIGPDQNDNPAGQSTDADLMDTSNGGGNALVGENSDSDAS